LAQRQQKNERYANGKSKVELICVSLGVSSDGKLLAVSHTYQHTGPIHVRVRIISAREATRRERQQYENEPR
jgi:uncharacterized DUF497 family protein